MFLNILYKLLLIAQLGILEPLIVRGSQKHAEKLEMVAGERRWRAAQRAGLTIVPCLISNYTNEQAAQMSKKISAANLTT